MSSNIYVEIRKLSNDELSKLGKHLLGILQRAFEIRELSSLEFDTWCVLDMFFIEPCVLVSYSELRKSLIEFYEQ